MMKAYVLHGIGDLRYEEVQTPVLEAGTVLVRVQAVGICGSDIPRIYRTGAYSHPLIPGHEFSGVVTESGAGEDAGWKGKRVGVFPLIPCMECRQCRRKQYEMCSRYSYLGSRTDGGFAEYVRVPVWNLIELPENVAFEQAAMLEPMAVAVHAIRRCNVQPAERIVLCGLGTIGFLNAMFLREMGCGELYVIGNKDLQQDMAGRLGIPSGHFCDIRRCDVEKWVAEVTEGNGADVFFDCVGNNQVLEQAVNCTAPSGRIMLVGNPASDMCLEKSVYWKILRRQLQLLGTWNSSFTHEDTDDWHYILSRLESGSIHPELLITHRFELGQLYQGMEIMRDKSEEYIKVMGCT